MSYICHWIERPITLDGVLNEPEWELAPKIENLMLMPARGESPQLAHSRTVARLLWSDEYLYFGAEMEDTDLYGIHEGHDPEFGSDDLIELFVKPGPATPSYWEFHITPRGATRDYFYARRYAGGDERWMAYDSGMKAAVTFRGTLNHWEDRDEGWTAEVAIPLAAFERAGGRPKPGDLWSFMVARYDYSVHLEAGLELSASAPLPSANFHLFEHYLTLIFQK